MSDGGASGIACSTSLFFPTLGLAQAIDTGPYCAVE